MEIPRSISTQTPQQSELLKRVEPFKEYRHIKLIERDNHGKESADIDDAKPTRRSDAETVEAAAQEVVDDAKAALKNPDVVAIVDEVVNRSGPIATESAKAVVDEARKRGVADVQVKAASSDKATVVQTEKGKIAVVQLGDGEKSREMDMEGEKILVLNSDLTEEEAKIETKQFIASKIESISNEFGLNEEFDPFFNFLFDQGFEPLVAYYGEYGVPRLLMQQSSDIFEYNYSVERVFDRTTKHRKET